MSWLIDFFKSLFGTITSVISFLISLVKSLIDFLISLPMFISTLTGSLGVVPSFMLTFVTITITVSVILIIIGRENKQ